MKKRYSNPRIESIVGFMFTFYKDNKYYPQIREICKGTSIPSTSVLNYYLDRMEKDEIVSRVRKIARGTSLTRLGVQYARELLGMPTIAMDEKHCPECGALLEKNAIHTDTKKQIAPMA